MSLKLKEYADLLKGEGLLVSYGGAGGVTPITSLTYNSKEAKSGTLYVCKGAAFKEDYLKEAVSLGACAYVSEKEYDVNVPGIIVSDVRKAMPHLAKAFYDIPEGALKIIAVTGTKGKTTTCYYLKKIFNDLGFKIAGCNSYFCQDFTPICAYSKACNDRSPQNQDRLSAP